MAKLEYYERHEFGDYIIELVAWRLPKGGYKYSFVLVKKGERILGFDNHERKPPHIHMRVFEKPYHFISLSEAISDFYKTMEDIIQDEERNHN